MGIIKEKNEEKNQKKKVGINNEPVLKDAKVVKEVVQNSEQKKVIKQNKVVGSIQIVKEEPILNSREVCKVQVSNTFVLVLVVKGIENVVKEKSKLGNVATQGR